MKFERFTVKTSVQIELQMIDQLEDLHKCGYIHNDLKPDNMLLRSRNAKTVKSSEIVLIDFGFAQEFLSDSGKHIDCTYKDKFSGNVLFQSPNAFKYRTLSRRDDLISLANILAFYFVGEVPWSNKIRFD
jgi:serine/threonine protein kinase